MDWLLRRTPSQTALLPSQGTTSLRASELSLGTPSFPASVPVLITSAPCHPASSFAPANDAGAPPEPPTATSHKRRLLGKTALDPSNATCPIGGSGWDTWHGSSRRRWKSWGSLCSAAAVVCVGAPAAVALAFSFTVCSYAWWPWPWGASPQHHPFVLFPAFATSRLKVTLTNQTFNSACPSSASFEFYAGHILPWSISEDCVMEAMRLRYSPGGNPTSLENMFSSQPGVEVEVADFGLIQCAPFYAPLMLTLQQAGLAHGKTLFTACYDFRSVPSVDVTKNFKFLDQAKALVERAHHGAPGGELRVYLGCHSNGCPMALGLLQAMPKAWVQKHVKGVIGYAGNWAGQGILYSALFTGVSFRDFSTQRTSSALTMQTWPSSYWTMSKPDVYGDSQVVIEDQATGKEYTPKDWKRLFQDAQLELAQELFPLLNPLTSISSAPEVDTHFFVGSGQATPVGTVLPSLAQPGRVLPLGTRDSVGDGNQEETDNESVLRWAGRACCKFEFNDLGGVPHALLPLSLRAQLRTVRIITRAAAAVEALPG